MRRARVIENTRCYHLISRLAHQAFSLDDEEKTRAVELLRRVEEFSRVIVLAYAIMSNHFHIFIYVPGLEELDDEEVLRRINVLYCDASLSQVLGEWKRLTRRKFGRWMPRSITHGRSWHLASLDSVRWHSPVAKSKRMCSRRGRG